MKQPWFLFQPQVVYMVSTKDPNGFTRCKPFSWVMPLNKARSFAIMMRTNSMISRTLLNLMDYPYFTMSWMKPEPEVAQKILMTTQQQPGSYDLQLFSDQEMEFDYPGPDAIAVAHCKAVKFIKKVPGLNPVTHTMTVCELIGWKVLCEGYINPLLHVSAREFAAPGRFEVPGY
jgi:hypothetical protein